MPHKSLADVYKPCKGSVRHLTTDLQGSKVSLSLQVHHIISDITGTVELRDKVQYIMQATSHWNTRLLDMSGAHLTDSLCIQMHLLAIHC